MKLLLNTDREGAFERLYAEAFPCFARLVRREGGTYDDARDVFHDAMIVLFEQSAAGKRHIDGTAKGYLLGIARNLWRRHCREAPPSEPLAGFDVPATEESPGAAPQLMDWLRRAGRKCMDMLQAFYYSRLSMQEIAREFGFAGERSATVQKYKCLEKVREQVKNFHYEEIPA